MKLSYNPKANIAYLHFRERTGDIDTVEVTPDFLADIDATGSVCGIEFLNANEQLGKSDSEKFWLDPEFWNADDEVWGDLELADFHETPRGAPYVWMLGRIVLDFNYTEHQLKTLLWSYIGNDFELTHSLTSQLGSVSVAKLIVSMARQQGELPGFLDLLEFAGKAFDVCRDNRNALAHSTSVEHIERDVTLWVRPSRKSEFQQVYMRISGKDLDRVSNDVAATARFITSLSMHRHMKIRGSEMIPSLPSKFNLPKKLKSREVRIKDELKNYGMGQDE